jgi:hypothetical protein
VGQGVFNRVLDLTRVAWITIFGIFLTVGKDGTAATGADL